ncbi:MAG: purine-binding chemotaxis protein CheW [Candidatus Schekmanbacteria bacterium]|nr:purine-binding chemotaxis protein CheW [Candidatus Schekmanbacteria bacterium]
MTEQQESGLQRLAGKYLSFVLGGESYAVQILKVQEIIQMMPVTRVPRTPPFVRGVINLRGKVIPVIDLRRRFELADREDTDRTCIIVAQVAQGEAMVVTMGVIVDEVAEVLDVRSDGIEPPPAFGSAVDTAFLLALAKVSGKLVMLVDIDKVLTERQVAAVEQLSR